MCNENLYDDFVEKAVAFASAYKLGNPLEQETSLGPMAHKRFAAEVRAQIAEAVAKGAKALVDPKLFPQDDGGAYLAPQILVDVDHSMKVMTRRKLRPRRRHHEGEERRGSAGADERLQVRADGLALDEGRRARRAASATTSKPARSS